MSGRVRLTFAAVLVSAFAACSDPPSVPTSSFSLPIDFAYACEGTDATTAPQYSGNGSEEVWCGNVTRNPPGGSVVTTQGALYGLVLNQDPAGVLLVSLDAQTSTEASVPGGTVLDADPFVPGFSPIRVGDNPIRLLRASDWGSFYVISAGSRTVTKIVLKSISSVMRPCGATKVEATETEACYELTVFDIPGTPSDAVIAGQNLVVSSAWSDEVWTYDLAETSPVPVARVLPGSIDQLHGLKDGRFVATWVERGVVSLLDADLGVVVERGVTYACADGIDNDRDGLVDHLDPDCQDGSDRDEAPDPATIPAPATTEPAGSYTAGADYCNDGVDNDGNGLTDAEEGARCAKPDGEALAECGDGIDNDGDGLTDTDDTSCFASHGVHEGQFGPFGQYQLAVVEAGESGTFAYVADEQRNRMAVFEVDDDLMNRVDVMGWSSVAPKLPFRPMNVDSLTNTCSTDDGCGLGDVCATGLGRCVDALTEVTTTGFPEYVYQGETDLPIAGSTINSMLGARVRGQLWDRAIKSGQVDRCTANCGGVYQPSWCDVSDTATCKQPEGDADTYYAFTPGADGKLRMVQSVVRGVPRHRYAQAVSDPDQRGWKLGGKPDLTFFGRRPQSIGNKPPTSYAFMGPINTEEVIEPAVDDVSPKRIRSYGVYAPPVDTFEQVASQSWLFDYEGVIPETRGHLGRLIDSTTFYAPAERFCESGVEVGDWLVVLAPRTAVAPVMHYEATLVTEAGDVCALEPVYHSLVQVRVTEVGMHTLKVDPATAQLVPVDQQLDELAIRASETNILNTCKNALDDFREKQLMLPQTEPGFGGYFVDLAEADFVPENFPSRLRYEVRAADAWTVTGGVVGFAHRWTWDGTQCVLDETKDPRLQGRLKTEAFDPTEQYATCPPENAQVDLAAMEGLPLQETPFENYSFSTYMLPGCETDETGTKVAVPDRRGTRWTFSVSGPDGSATSSLGEAAFTRRLQTIEDARAIVYMDTAGNRMRLLRFWHRSNTGQSFSRLFD